MIVLNRELIQEVDGYIETNRNTFSDLGDCFFDVFSYDKEKNNISTQIRNLQQITCSATRFADVEDFVKNQMGKERVDQHHQPKWRQLGDEVLQGLESLRVKSQELDSDTTKQMAVRLRLAPRLGSSCSEPIPLPSRSRSNGGNFMTFVHLLSDTVYRQQAVKQLCQLLGGGQRISCKGSTSLRTPPNRKAGTRKS